MALFPVFYQPSASTYAAAPPMEKYPNLKPLPVKHAGEVFNQVRNV